MKTTIHTLKNEYKDNQTYLNEKQKTFSKFNLSYDRKRTKIITILIFDIKKFLIFIINVLIQMKQLHILMKNMINN